MTVTETVLVFVGIPLGVILLVFLATYGKVMMHQPNRYRPGKAWDYEPSWFVPHPDALLKQPGGSGSTTAVGGAVGEW